MAEGGATLAQGSAWARHEGPLIVTCEQCATQFHLDDAKVPPGGVRVRCSRCKHAFFIEPAGDSPELGSIDRAAQDALHAQAPLAPEAAEDLSAEPGSEFEDSGEFGRESDWEFNRASFSADLPEERDGRGSGTRRYRHRP